jgi:transcriptional regulator with XRE-family HTH domain
MKVNVERNVQQYLKANGISQKHIAQKIGLSPSSLCMTLNGKRKMRLEELELICQATNKDPAFFFQFEKPDDRRVV